MTFLDELMLQLPLGSARIPKGGTNREGLTWEEWEAAARWTGAKPANMYEGGQWAHAWAHGVDPSEMFHARAKESENA